MKKLLMPLAVALFSLGTMQAAVIGTIGFSDIGQPLAEGSTSGDINTSTMFTIGELFSDIGGTGVFAGLPHQDFGAVAFDSGVGTSLSFSNAVFGTFTSTSIIEPVNTPGIIGFYILGNYTTGTYAGLGGAGQGPSQASFTLTFNQTPPSDGSISDSATFSIPPATPPGTPEPASMVLMGSALIGLAMIRRRRKV